MASGSRKDPQPAYTNTVESITNIYKSLPQRPSIEDLEAAKSVLQTLETEQNTQLEQISNKIPPKEVDPELFTVHQEMMKNMILFQGLEQRKEAAHLVELDRIFQVFDGLIQRASVLVCGVEKKEMDSGKDVIFEVKKNDEEGVMKSSGGDLGLKGCSSSKGIVLSSAAGASEKLNLMKVASLIEKSAKKGARVLDLQGKLMEKIEWLPLSLGKLSSLTELYLSENRIMALPASIGNLSALTKLEIRANQVINLPSTFGELQNLTDLNLAANMLKSLPESFGNLKNLTNLDLSSNRFLNLPDTIGDLTSLQRLIVETNDLEELPHAIGLCSSLVELRLDFNQLKALPEAIGTLEHLEILTLHYNRIKRFPSTMGNLLQLRELDISFNELESIPETLCLDISLEKLNLGKNFADLRVLPESIGNLEMLEELDISYNQIKMLPDSFRFLSKLRKFSADETPLEVPPKAIMKLGAQAVVEYMADLVSTKDVKSQQAKKKRGFWSYICPLLCFGNES